MYEYQYQGKKGHKFQLVEARDLVVVRTAEATKLVDTQLSTTSRNLLPKMLPIASFPEANVTIFKCISKAGRNTMQLRNQIRKNLNEESSIKFAGRVLKDLKSGEPVIYTENFFVKFKDNVLTSKCEEVITKLGLSIKEALVFAKNAYFVVAPKGTGLQIFEISNKLLSNTIVEYCHPELVRQKKHRSIFEEQWHLRPVNKNGQLIDQHVHVEGAWQTTRGEGITIAVIDDGVDQEHEEFKGKIVAPFDAVLNIPDGNPKARGEDHGTCCAGVACAAGRNKASGVAPEALLMPIRSGGLGSLAEAKALSWAADNGADVISCSWGPMDGPWWDTEDPRHFIPFFLPDSTRLAIDYATRTGRNGKGCVITWASGNGNESVDYDGYASYPKVITVAASNDTGVRSYYSDYGEAVWCCFPSSDVDALYVPVPRRQPLTSGIWTTDRRGDFGYNLGADFSGDKEGNYNNSFGGTSSSCPGVAGVVALMLSANPNLNWQEVKTLIKKSCDKIDKELGNYDANGHSPFYGYGKINATKAVVNALKANEEENEGFEIDGVAQFSKKEDILIQKGELIGELPAKKRLLSFSLNLDPYHPNLSIKYRTKINNLGYTEWSTAGEVNGTSDRRRKIIGVELKLTGTLANEYDLKYQVKVYKKEDWLSAENGTTAGTTNRKGRTIEEIKIKIIKK